MYKNAYNVLQDPTEEARNNILFGIISGSVNKFLEDFPSYRRHKQPEHEGELWVFDSKDEGGGSQCISPSGTGDCQTTLMIQDRIKSALSSQIKLANASLLFQLWVPVEIGGRRLLSTSAQPFAFTYLHEAFTHDNRHDDDVFKYRRKCVEYKYDIEDVNYTPEGQDDSNPNPLIITNSGTPATAFLNRLAHILKFSKDTKEDPWTKSAIQCDLLTSIMIPICSPSQTSPSCIGVLECSSFCISESTYNKDSPLSSWLSFGDMTRIRTALEEAGLSICGVQQHIPYKTVPGLELVRDQIKEAIKIICLAHNLILSQVWIANYEDKHHVPFSSSFKCTKKKQMLALKLTGYSADILSEDSRHHKVIEYNQLYDIFPLDTGDSLVEETLQDYESRFYNTYDRLYKIPLIMAPGDVPPFDLNGIVICLTSIDTGDVCYAFEFAWFRHSNCVIFLVEHLLLTLKRHLPSFKFASGAELGDDSHVINVENSTEGETKIFKIFKGKRVSSIPEALEKGKKLVVVDDIAPLKRKQTAAIELSREQIVLQFGNTQVAAAKVLKVSVSTLKRKCNDYGIKWQGRLKSKVSRNQSNTNEEDSGAILVPSARERNEDTMTIKAEYSDGMIRFELPMSEATFISVEKEVVKQFKLTPETYTIRYNDKDNDWILLTPDYDMSYCLRSSKNSDQNLVRLRVECVPPSA